jgi:membrane protease YdiL (CAAX protease family)
VPSVRIIACWVATIVLFFSLIYLSAGANFQAFLNDYYNTLFWMPNILYMIFAWLGPEELFFRVYLQTRLEKLMPVGWAIIIQSLLFSIIHIPGNAAILGWGWSVVPHLANTLLLTNGLIGGYLWHRTKSLPILIVYHLTTYPLMPLIFFPFYYLSS